MLKVRTCGGTLLQGFDLYIPIIIQLEMSPAWGKTSERRTPACFRSHQARSASLPYVFAGAPSATVRQDFLSAQKTLYVLERSHEIYKNDYGVSGNRRSCGKMPFDLLHAFWPHLL